ncbi:MAG: DNRLRE domain-containing protein, partial [Clostridia bacterium]|nr:DNRLRE domain-containing protein [Clostridia bacterium]
LGEWFNIRFLVSPLTGFCEVYINGQNLLSYKIGKPTTLAKSQVRFFDARYSYTAYFSNISVYTDSSYRIGLIDEDSADFLAYQTTKVADNKFDLRLISGIDIADITTYNHAGFNIITLWDENGTVMTKEQNVYSTEVCKSVIANGQTVSAESLGTTYMAAIPVKGVPANKGSLEIIVRPFVKKGGIRSYGDAMILSWTGDLNDGHPVFAMADSSVEYTAFPSDDTFVKLNNAENFGDKTSFELKNNGQKNEYTREIYIKFSFSDVALKRLLSSNRIYLEFYVNSHRALTDDESAEGGILADVCGVDTKWTESELTGRNYEQLAAELEYIGDVRYKSKEYTQIDVTDYVLSHAGAGSVAFKISNVENDGASGQMSVASSEASTGSPRLVIHPIMYNHEINLNKLQNVGYEPWGYAEKLVDEWFKTDYDLLYSTPANEDVIPNWNVDNASPVGDYTVKIDWKASTPTGKWNSKVYSRTLDTLKGYTASTLSEYDEFGGITNSGVKGEATGYFHTETIGGRTYIIDPLGNPFFAAGINTAQLGDTDKQKEAALAKYGSAENFYKEVTQELRDMGITTYWGGDVEFMEQNKLARAIGLGCISGYMGRSNLNLGISTGGSAEFLHNNTMNVFDPDFISYCNTKVATTVSEYLGNPYVLGFYSDNEIPAETNMLYRYLTIDPTEPVNAFSYATAWTWLARHTGNPNATINDIDAEMAEEFKAFVYNRYFKCVT